MGEDVELFRLAPLYCATNDDMSIALWPKDTRLAKKTKARCLIASLDWAADYTDEIPCSLIAVSDFLLVFKTLSFLQKDTFFRPFDPVATRFIDQRAIISAKAHIGRAHIASDAFIEGNAFIGDDVVIEEGVIISAGAVIHGPSHIGRLSRIGSNSVIGTAAFVPYLGHTLASLGGVIIGPNVELGALCTVDRGLVGITRIMDKSRIDNMVHVGHDVFIGSDVAVAAQSGFAGFAQVHDGVSIGGQSGVGPQVVIGKGARLSGKSFAHSDIKPFELWSGNPALPHDRYLRAYARDKRYKKD